MESGSRSGGRSGVVVQNRTPSGCLIVRKKGNGLSGPVGSSSNSRKPYVSKKVKKRPKVVSSDTESSDSKTSNSETSGLESSDELLMPPARRLGSETIRVCNGLNAFEQGVAGSSAIGSKRDRLEQIRQNGDGMGEEDGLERRERKHSKVDVFDFDEYDDMDVDMMRMRRSDAGIRGGRFEEAMHAARSGSDKEVETGSSRHIVYKRRKSCHERASGLYLGDSVDHGRFKKNRDAAQRTLPLPREKFSSDGSIRVQGEHGVLKVMVNKKKVSGPPKLNDHRKPIETRQSLSVVGSAKRNVHIHPSSYSETKPVDKHGLHVRPKKKQIATRKSLSSKDSMGDEQDSDNSDTSLNVEVKNTEARKSSKRITSEDEKTPKHEKLPTTRMKEVKVKRGSGTEKQRLRERIREMLLNAGWNIDYRPRKNRDYLDAVYINPAGTAYWSIIKAYEALQKQLNDDDPEIKPKGESSSFAPIADDVLSQLTRKTRKKMEKELKKRKKQRDDSESDSGKDLRIKRSSSNKHDMIGMDSDSNEEKLSSFIKQGSKSMKTKMIENAVNSGSSKSQNAVLHPNDGTEKSFSGNDLLHGRKSRKHGRCTLLVRSSNIGSNLESDDFVPYTGKRTVLSWLIDLGTVQLSQKVQYRKKKRLMQKGWITRDGIHCGCCSKILTVSKFELHAGSKLRQPYQNIYLDSGDSLLQCQIDALNRQENSEKISFHSVDIDGNDPNDDTCGICGDGGDLICCDGCPSTFHLSCLDIQMLPPGEWHCPNCTCKFCGIASGTVNKEDDSTVHALLTCNLCEKKYHERCTKKMDAVPANSIMSGPSFCGRDCKELFEHLKKYIGTKHELDAGFTWSLIHRTDEDSEATSREIAQRVECNSKLAVALTVMDECFLPVVDRRSGVNLIHNVLYNVGSNFSRLNYSGFYTAILERGDEIISAASIRFRGTKLAEMPFIGTRHVHRHQGMCRRLFSAIESVLCSLKVEKLVIPAISELVHTWTKVFGFTHLEESRRREMRSLNMLVFPGIDMLQKLLVVQGKLEGLEKMEHGDEVSTKLSNASRLDMDSSALQDPHGSDDASSNPDDEINNECSDASQELNNQVLVDRNVYTKSHSEERLSGSVSDKCVSPSSNNHGGLEKNDESHSSPKCQNDTCVSSPTIDAPDCRAIPGLGLETVCSDPDAAKNLVEPVTDRICRSLTDMHCDSLEHGINPVLDSQVGDIALCSKEVDMNDVHDEVPEAVPSVNLSEEKITKDNSENVDVSGSVLNHAGESSLRVRSDSNDEAASEGEKHLEIVASHETGLIASGDSFEADQVQENGRV